MFGVDETLDWTSPCPHPVTFVGGPFSFCECHFRPLRPYLERVYFPDEDPIFTTP